MYMARYSTRRKHCTAFLLIMLCLCLTACSGSDAIATPKATPVPTQPAPSTTATIPIAKITSRPGALKDHPQCLTPYQLRLAYEMEPLTEQGFTGAGQTVVEVVSYGSPTLQQDLNVFDQQFDLPALIVPQLAPIGSVKFDPSNQDMASWALETSMDIEIIHTMAPLAHIVVLTSPVDETEGVTGFPQFLQLEQYAVNHQLGHIFSQSYAADDPTFPDARSRQFTQNYASFYQQITTRQGWTILGSSGDGGTPDVQFPADVPWVTAVGGTSLTQTTNVPPTFTETVWSESSGGTSQLFSEPDYQKTLPAAIQVQLHGQRGTPDIAADANPATGMAIYTNGQWNQAGGTSASAPTWSGILAVADQMAGHPLGFINPALYKIGASAKAAQDFRDITSGSTNSGYQPTPGWDFSTGWGSPLLDKLLPDLIAAVNSQ